RSRAPAAQRADRSRETKHSGSLRQPGERQHFCNAERVMLDRTTEVPAESKVEIPAISVQYHVGFGETRALTLTTGIELDADPGTINRLLDKIVDSGERQRDRF